MNREDVAILLAYTLANYPHMQGKEMRPTAALWLDLLADLPFEVAKAAIQTHMATGVPHFPGVGEIRSAALGLQPGGPPDPAIAWQEVRKAFGAYGRDRTPPWSHPVIAATVNAIGWRELCNSEEGDTTLFAQFRNTYQTMAKRSAEAVLLPPAVREIAGQLASTLALPDKRAAGERGRL